jgi:hypothetical protein
MYDVLSPVLLIFGLTTFGSLLLSMFMSISIN